MTANRREADFVWLDEASEIDGAAVDAAMRRAGIVSVTLNGVPIEDIVSIGYRPRIPPGLARNRRAREAWIDLTPGARRAKRKLRVERGYISRTWGWP